MVLELIKMFYNDSWIIHDFKLKDFSVSWPTVDDWRVSECDKMISCAVLEYLRLVIFKYDWNYWIQYNQRHSVINHWDRYIAHLGDMDISFVLFNISSKFLCIKSVGYHIPQIQNVPSAEELSMWFRKSYWNQTSQLVKFK
jgi:hypothetical protein